MRILGIDPGSRATGYGIIDVVSGRGSQGDGLSVVGYGVIRPVARDPLSLRLAHLQQRLGEILAQYEPQVGSVERVFVAAYPRSVLVLGQARGVALAAVGSMGIPLAEYTPTQIKSAVVGVGQADKKQVQGMVQKLLGLAKQPPTDAADALAAAICHAQSGRLSGLSWRGSGKRRGKNRSRGFVVRRVR